jgi:ArsR family transcriptional regulator
MQGMRTIATVAATCAPLSEAALSAADAQQLATVLKAIADPSRLRLLSLIKAQPGCECCVCNLTEPLGLTQPTVSHHLRVLREAGLLEREQRGQWAYYRIADDQLALLRDLLT